MTTDTARDALGHWIPGMPSPNPSGRPKIKTSLTKLLIDRLDSDASTANDIVSAWIDACKARDMRAISEMLDRTEGKVADKHLIQAMIVHVGDDYAQLGLQANKRALEARESKFLTVSSTNEASKSEGIMGESNDIP